MFHFPRETKIGGNVTDGGIAQLARAIGSYPIGHGFKSNFRYQNETRKGLVC